MNKKYLCILLPAILAGCGSDSGGDNDDFYDQYEGLYVGQSGYMFFDDTSNNILHDVIIVDTVNNTVSVPTYAELNGLDISFSSFYEGMVPDNWSLLSNTPNTIKLSGHNAEVSILNETLTKVRSGRLTSYQGLEITNFGNFTLTTGGCTYTGRYEFDDNGYYELDDDIPMGDTCGRLNNVNTEMYFFERNSKAYSLIYDKHFNTVVSISEHNAIPPVTP